MGVRPARDVNAGGEQDVALEVHQSQMTARADVDVVVDAAAGLREERPEARSRLSARNRLHDARRETRAGGTVPQDRAPAQALASTLPARNSCRRQPPESERQELGLHGDRSQDARNGLEALSHVWADTALAALPCPRR